MLCQKCGKRPATVHFTNMINGIKVEYYLCDQCASHSDLGQLELQDLLSGFFGIQSQKEQKLLICEGCHSSLDEVKKQGKVGCANCYKVFASYLDPIIRQVHGSDLHTGKRTTVTNQPKEASTFSASSSKLEELQAKMNQAVANENYEEAAKLRDEIATLKKGATE